MRSISCCWSLAIQSLPSRLAARNSSNASSNPSRIIPPSFTPGGGASTIARRSRSTSSGSSESSLSNCEEEPGGRILRCRWRFKHLFFRPGGGVVGLGSRELPQDALESGNLFQSRARCGQVPGVARPHAQPADGAFQIAHLRQARRETLRAARHRARATAGRLPGVWRMASTAERGWPSHSRSRRAPMGVTVRLRAPIERGGSRGIVVQRLKDFQIAQGDGVERRGTRWFDSSAVESGGRRRGAGAE